jgi:hypothetical protein
MGEGRTEGVAKGAAPGIIVLGTVKGVLGIAGFGKKGAPGFIIPGGTSPP